MRKAVVSLIFSAAFLAGCVSVPPPPNRSATDPSDPASPQASTPRYKPNFVASTKVYLDPSVGEGAQKMDHSKMQGMEGMGGMEGMDHSKMPGMESKPAQGASPAPSGGMQRMDHSKMPGMESKQPQGASPSPSGGMEGMDHSQMKGTASPAEGAAASPASKEAIETEMKKTSDEMKKLSDELKEKSDAAKAAEKPGAKSQPAAASPAATYSCPMHPEVRQARPGKCPKCGMKLAPKSSAQ